MLKLCMGLKSNNYNWKPLKLSRSVIIVSIPAVYITCMLNMDRKLNKILKNDWFSVMESAIINKQCCQYFSYRYCLCINYYAMNIIVLQFCMYLHTSIKIKCTCFHCIATYSIVEIETTSLCWYPYTFKV